MDIVHCFPEIISLYILSTIVEIYGCVCVLQLITKSVHVSCQNSFVTYTNDAAVGNIIIGAKPGVVVYFSVQKL